MWWILESLYALAYNSFIDFMLFILVDAIAKPVLRQANTEDEKKMIWLYEGGFLGALTLLVYSLHHAPYVLFLLALVTVMYTQLLGKVDFISWWRWIVTKWEEHQHHTDNVKMIKAYYTQREKLMRQMKVDKPLMAKLTDFILQRQEKKVAPPIVAPVFSLNSMISEQNALVNQQNSSTISEPTTGYINVGVSPSVPISAQFYQRPILSANPTNSTQTISMHSTQRLLLNSQQTGTGLPQVVHSPVKQPASVYSSAQVKPLNNWFTQNELKRRPLRTYQQQSEFPQTTFGATKDNIKNKFMSVLGYTSSTEKPVGLRNDGRNLCFMNCVIQCLAHTPELAEKVVNESKSELNCSVAESAMLSTLAELISQCGKVPSSKNVLDPVAFREAVSVLNKELVAAPSEYQHEQDAAEFFMWLMESLNNVLNKKISQGPVFHESDSSLETLKRIYGDLSPANISSLKEACRKEISEADGRRIDSYAEPIQRLSDLEWLTYKRQNQFLIDKIFTGQLVDAYHCLVDNHLSVNTQTFNILPVPIVSPREVSGLVFLDDCFTKFCNIEQLVGQEALQCTFCNRNSGIHEQDTPSRNIPRKTRDLIKQSSSNPPNIDFEFHSSVMPSTYMSPILGTRDIVNDSGFHDNVFRTSTPVGDAVNNRLPLASHHIGNAQRRCLLRQLPDCLVIQLIRFACNQFTGHTRKINESVSIPIKGLDLTNIVYDNVTNREDLTAGRKSHKYDLYAVCCHLGAESTSYGHYVCYCKANNGVWYKFDDELVWDVNMEYEITTGEVKKNAYLLFYRRALEQS